MTRWSRPVVLATALSLLAAASALLTRGAEAQVNATELQVLSVRPVADGTRIVARPVIAGAPADGDRVEFEIALASLPAMAVEATRIAALERGFAIALVVDNGPLLDARVDHSAVLAPAIDLILEAGGQVGLYPVFGDGSVPPTRDRERLRNALLELSAGALASGDLSGAVREALGALEAIEDAANRELLLITGREMPGESGLTLEEAFAEQMTTLSERARATDIAISALGLNDGSAARVVRQALLMNASQLAAITAGTSASVNLDEYAELAPAMVRRLLGAFEMTMDCVTGTRPSGELGIEVRLMDGGGSLRTNVVVDSSDRFPTSRYCFVDAAETVAAPDDPVAEPGAVPNAEAADAAPEDAPDSAVSPAPERAPSAGTGSSLGWLAYVSLTVVLLGVLATVLLFTRRRERLRAAAMPSVDLSPRLPEPAPIALQPLPVLPTPQEGSPRERLAAALAGDDPWSVRAPTPAPVAGSPPSASSATPPPKPRETIVEPSAPVIAETARPPRPATVVESEMQAATGPDASATQPAAATPAGGGAADDSLLPCRAHFSATRGAHLAVTDSGGVTEVALTSRLFVGTSLDGRVTASQQPTGLTLWLSIDVPDETGVCLGRTYSDERVPSVDERPLGPEESLSVGTSIRVGEGYVEIRYLGDRDPFSAPNRAQMRRLVKTAGPTGSPPTLEVGIATVVVGRSPETRAGEIAAPLGEVDELSQLGVSSTHALLWMSGGFLYVCDDNSLNGTFVRGEYRLPPYHPWPLVAGDTVSFGRHCAFRVE